MIGAAAGEVMAAVHTAMLAGISYSSANVRFWHKADIARSRGVALQSCADSISPMSCNYPTPRWIEQSGGGGLGRATPGRPPISSGERHHAVTRRPVGAVSRRSRHKTRPCNIRASGTAKVGTMTRG